MTANISTATLSSPTTPRTPPIEMGDASRYQPGVCNIGPAEIAKRRRAGDMGAIVAIAAFIVLVAIQASPLLRGVVVGLIAAGAASGYLQAYLKFCAGFGQLGIFNFGELGTTEHVVDQDARRRDKRRARQIAIGAGLIGLAVGVVAAIVPV